MNPLPTNGQMTMKDAAIVALFLMLGVLATVYFPTHSYDLIIADPPRALFELLVIAFVTWVVQFLMLTGLNSYAKSAQEKSG